MDTIPSNQLTLPAPRWLTLSETLSLVASLTGAAVNAVERSTRDALIDEVIEAQGVCETYSGGMARHRITGRWWGAAMVDWAGSTLKHYGPNAFGANDQWHIFSGVVVSRESLERWLGGTGTVEATREPSATTADSHPTAVPNARATEPEAPPRHRRGRGRQHGEGTIDDTEPLKRMAKIIESGDAPNPWQAALIVIDEMPELRGPSVDSKAKRLSGKYNKEHFSQ